MKKMRAALILDQMSLKKWQANALEEAFPFLDIQLVLSCENTRTKKRYIKHFLYYVLNILSLKNHLTKSAPFEYEASKTLSFKSKYQGLWQVLPDQVLDRIETENISVIIKFGMSLLKIDDRLAHYDILSYHHGNPSKYRGRPAGFYELLNSENKCGIIVQKLTNKLDAGDILAFGEAKTVQHSYKKTSLNFYNASRYLLKSALINLSKDHTLNLSKKGKNYTLPGNFTVLRLIAKLQLSFFQRILYGLFYEKKWQVAITKNIVNLNDDTLVRQAELKELPIRKKYNFYADPFYSLDGDRIRLEALDNKTGLEHFQFR